MAVGHAGERISQAERHPGGRLLIQSQTPDSGLASHHLSVEDTDLCPIPG